MKKFYGEGWRRGSEKRLYHKEAGVNFLTMVSIRQRFSGHGRLVGFIEAKQRVIDNGP